MRGFNINSIDTLVTITHQAMLQALQNIFGLSILVILVGVLAAAFICARLVRMSTPSNSQNEGEELVLKSSMLIE